jgi:hypothetical protein
LISGDRIGRDEDIGSCAQRSGKLEIVTVFEIVGEILGIVRIDDGIHKIVIERNRPILGEVGVDLSTRSTGPVLANPYHTRLHRDLEVLEDI